MQGMETGKQAQDPKEEPIELQQDPTEETLRDMQDEDLNDANIVVDEVGDDGELDGALQEGPTEDQLSTQGITKCEITLPF